MFNGYKKDIAAAAPKIEELQEGYPTEGSPSLGIPATQPGAAWFHMITTELLNAIKELGVLPDKNSLNQLATAILTLKFPSGTAFKYLRDKNYSKNDIVFTNNHLYLCMSNNGPATAVVAPETNDSVWQKIPLKQDVLALVPDATTSVKGIVQLCDNIEQNASNTSMAVTPHAVAQQNFIKSINGTKPDTSGNVSITRVDSAASADTAKSATKATNADKATHASTADSATKATQDSAGQQINSTYIKSLSVNGRTITYTKGDGSTGTITTQDTNTTYSKLSQFTNDSGYISDGHNFSSGVTVNGYKITVG
ncbi:predicted protein [Succinatimonas sp. CAG:777]|jgi:hypothetical protein|nr:predicted protein [Succinatimonas sp. CAG:777]